MSGSIYFKSADKCLFERCNFSFVQATMMTSCSFIDFLNDNCIFYVRTDKTKPLYSNKNITIYLGDIIFTDNVPIPNIENHPIPIPNIYSNTTKLKPKESMKFNFITETFEINDCQFIDLSFPAENGSAINIYRPMYEYILYDPKISVESCYFYNCISESNPAVLSISYINCSVTIKKMCSFNCAGAIYMISNINTLSTINFNSSTIFSNSDNSLKNDITAIRFNAEGANHYSYSFGCNQTHGSYNFAASISVKLNVSFSHYENLTSMLGFAHPLSSFINCNFVEIICYPGVIRLHEFIPNLTFNNCVFCKTNYLDIFE
ncbi:hypothetical protein TVAG_399460 [Trichomonas vaginalis G3]|uniref:Surface antigen BspA-like n=1 Tax=Trichomonas vaginalis (strain ATCC PRA-98 / G3) TaxID=412133 RepID=A2E5Y4_TRIV3|nr:hypothetical protein TVAGG3_0337600 [Trichomonas vaginalis G3]EAY11941.1 hypothetical protein TVAG_399460 [Trichomonas vaginalis G3]KAI5530394.1 hypothetical protein TVAGG3_0337600 [Trichomonas vaginalis G3]|eukprot:XP_001324164.1 hypothetical protein [Trichomonas vaginalis G3]